MISVTTKRFRKAYSELPPSVKQAARNAYKLWKKNPNHPSLHFKQIHEQEPVFSVRIGLAWRALGVKPDKDKIIWFWIGSHGDYDKLVSSL